MRDRIHQLLQREPSDKQVVAEGWVRTKRESKNVCFLNVNDGSCLNGLQVVIDKSTFPADKLNRISTGSSVVCEGIIVKSMGGNQKVEMQCLDIPYIGECPNDYPLQKKYQTLEYLRSIAHLRSRTNSIGAVMRVRNTLAYATHQWFQENGFLYVHTPIISCSDAEGAGDQFTVTTMDLDNIPRKDGKIDWSEDFFGKMAKLTVSGQLEGETYASSMKNIYTFGPTFRSENSLTKRHLAEFWMIEPEMSFCDIEGNMEVAESYLKYLFSQTLERNSEDLAFFEKRIQKGIVETLETVINKPFAHMSYTDAIRHLEKHNEKFEFPVEWGADIQTEHERYLTEQVCKAPVIVTDYPADIKAFYMKMNPDRKTVRGMDVLVPRLGEIIGGSEREADYDTLVARMKELQLDPEQYWWYLDLRKYGSVPHSGFGLGFERAVMYVTGMQNIRDVIPYPRAVHQAEF